MPDPEHLAILEGGVQQWNQWRKGNPHILPSLRRAEISAISLAGADLSRADLKGANLAQSDLRQVNLNFADLYKATLWQANLSGATLIKADLSNSNFNRAILRDADLSEANLRFARFILADVEGANLSSCHVYGCSFWNLKGTPAHQLNVVITPTTEPEITVDNIELAQFMYLLLRNQNIRSVIDTITAKMVLILGRFSAERKRVLEALREELRIRNYMPVLFDFERPGSRDLTETIATLAHMARFVIADITDARSIPQELALIVPHLPSVPVQPILLSSRNEYGMFEHFQRYPWVLPIFSYRDQAMLMERLKENVIAPAEARIASEAKNK